MIELIASRLCRTQYTYHGDMCGKGKVSPPQGGNDGIAVCSLVHAVAVIPLDYAGLRLRCQQVFVPPLSVFRQLWWHTELNN